MNNLITLFTLLFPFTILAQGNIPIGTWRSHFNYQETLLVEQVGNKIYCVGQSGIFYLDLSDNSINTLSKINGLSDVSVSAINYDENTGILALGYDNGNIDLILEREIFNISQIKDADITQGKAINQIDFDGGLIYLSTNFGLIVLNPENREIEEAFQNLGANGEQTAINGMVLIDGFIYLATDIGILRGEIASSINLQDFNNWERFGGSFVDGQEITYISVDNQKVLATNGTEIYSLENNIWLDTGFESNGDVILKLRGHSTGVLVILEHEIQNISNNSTSQVLEELELSLSDAFLSDQGVLWVTDNSRGLTRIEGTSEESIAPNGIFPGTVARLLQAGDQILALPKSISDDYLPINNMLGYSSFEGGVWTNFVSPELMGFDDLTGISSGLKFYSSFSDGILNLQEGIVYDETNSPLQLDANSYYLVAGIAEDAAGNLWVANSNSTPLLRRSPSGDWLDFSFPLTASSSPEKVKISPLGQVWLQLHNTSSGGLIAFDPATEEYRFINNSDGLPSSSITDFEFTLDDEIWIATDRGLAFFPFGFGLIEDNSIGASQPVFENRILFDNEFISAIEIDGGNRKWIGTNNGLWLFEDNVDKLLVNFNEDNSPLISNNIIDLKINSVTGELFIATDKGLVSYRTDATNGAPQHQMVNIFPNPVLPGYTGLVGISGLASDVNVKITSVSGRLVKELNAAGGSTSWDVSDHNGVRAQSGVYMVFSSTPDGNETFVGKIAVIN